MADASPIINGGIASLQSNDTRSLLDVIDNLRSQGISRYIDLPQIVVCGEQSSGKSSVLEAISGLKFPSKETLCTRFATELILRRGQIAPVKISIVPGFLEERPDADNQKLLDFKVSATLEDLHLDEVIESAKEAMGIDTETKVFSSDILRIELSGPDQPHLTLVDLPGLFQAGSRSQSEADSETVKSLVLRYIRSPRSIILAVVSAKNDFNNQSITKYSREIDRNGTRTLGLITKPDTLDEGSESENFYIELAQNKDVKFRLGWHVVRNRDYLSRDSSTRERDLVEDGFFSSGVWRTLPKTQVGVHSLKPRLSKILKDQILLQLPDVITQVNDGITECTRTLNTLGPSRSTAQEQRRYLLNASVSFNKIITAAADGRYFNAFFGDASTVEGYEKRLRAVVQNTLTTFSETMRNNGQKFEILDEVKPKHAHQISRPDYISKVKLLLKRSRGRELPGTFDPLIIGQLFHEQRSPWSGIVQQTVQDILYAVSKVVKESLAQVVDQSTVEGIMAHFIGPRLENLTTGLRNRVNELLRPHYVGHPITYNHYLTENVQKAQSNRRVREVRKSLERLLGGDYAAQGVVNLNINVQSLIDNIVNKTEADMNNYASSTVTDFMEAYYKVALKRFVDDFSVLAVEACLIEKLPTVFSPVDILEIDDATALALAYEPEEAVAQRLRSVDKLQVLGNGLRALRSMQGYESSSSVLPAGLDPKDVLKINTNHENISWGAQALQNQVPAPEYDSFLIRAPIVFPIDPDPPMIKPEHTVPEEGPSELDNWAALSSTSFKKKKKKVKTLSQPLPPPPEPAVPEGLFFD